MLHSFHYKTLYQSLWQKAEVGPKQEGLCSHCSSWPPTKGPLQKHSPWKDQATSPPKVLQVYRDRWAKHILPISWEITHFSEHISIGTLEETRTCNSTTPNANVFIHIHTKGEKK